MKKSITGICLGVLTLTGVNASAEVIGGNNITACLQIGESAADGVNTVLRRIEAGRDSGTTDESGCVTFEGGFTDEPFAVSFKVPSGSGFSGEVSGSVVVDNVTVNSSRAILRQRGQNRQVSSTEDNTFSFATIDPDNRAIISTRIRDYEVQAEKAPPAIFMTSIGFDGNLGGLAGADQLCTSVANSEGSVLPEDTYFAYMGDSITPLSFRAGTVEQNKVLASYFAPGQWEPLGGEQGPMFRDESGEISRGAIPDVPFSVAWVGNFELGPPYPSCLDWTSNSPEITGFAVSWNEGRPVEIPCSEPVGQLLCVQGEPQPFNPDAPPPVE